MKNLLKSLFLAASVCVLLAGCNGLNTVDATVSSDSVAEGYGWLTINVDDLQGYRVAGRSAGRTINPVSLTDESDTLTKFVLKGKSTITGASLLKDGEDGIPLTFVDDDNNAETPVVAAAEIPFGAWDLTLEAYQGSVVVLQGRTYVDLKTPKASIAFTLTTDNLTTAGSVDLQGYFVDAGTVVKKYKAGLYSLSDGNLKVPASISAANVTAGDADAEEDLKKNPSFTFNQTSVAPGRYSFQVRFYGDDACTKQVGFWEDIIVVAPGRKTEDKTIDCKNIIMQLPDSPTGLMAYLVDNSEDEDENYTVLLKWTDNSHNEENFVVTIKEYNGTGTLQTEPTTYAVLGVDAADPNVATDKREIFWSSAKNAGGSLRTSSDWCMIKLPLGRIFDVSIQAENFVGLSKVSNTVDAFERIAATGTETVPDTTPALTTTNITTTHINRMAIKYDLANGKLTLAEDGSEKTGTYTIYKSIYETGLTDKTAADLLVIDNADDDANHLVSGRYPFEDWVNLDDSPVTSKLTKAGAEVKATYNKSTNITYDIDNKYYTISATAKYGTGTTDVKNTSFDAKANSNLIFAVTSNKPGETEGTFVAADWIRVSITNLPGDPIDSGKVSAATYTFDETEGLMSGPHTVTVKAHLAGEPAGTIYEFTFALGLER